MKSVHCPVNHDECFSDDCTIAVCQTQKIEEEQLAAEKDLAGKKTKDLAKLYDDLGIDQPPKSTL
jgi:hypothetical protein